MTLKKLSIFTLFFLLAYFQATAQHDHSHEHDHVNDEVQNYHLGLGVGAASFSGENDIAPAIHVHFLRRISNESNWSVGLGYEGIIQESWHNGVNLLLNYRPFHFLSFNIGPGIVTEKEDDEREFLPALHAESVFEFHVSGIHFGPMVGWGINKEHQHISLGVHIGFGL